jgi:DNA-binding CsgD family transcriptional regulator
MHTPWMACRYLCSSGAAVRCAPKPTYPNRAPRAGHGNDERLWNTIFPSSLVPLVIAGFTRSELRVLLAMAPGLSVKEAAEMLAIGENTAKTHLQHIHSKTGTSKQTELIRLFMSSTPPVNAGQQPAGRC